MNGAGHANSFNCVMGKFHLGGNGAGKIGNLLLVTCRVRVSCFMNRRFFTTLMRLSENE